MSSHLRSPNASQHSIYIDKAATALRYDVSVHTIVSWVKKEYIPHLRCGRLIRFDPAELERWDSKRAIAGRTEITAGTKDGIPAL